MKGHQVGKDVIRHSQCRDQLACRGQQHVLAWWDELDSVGRDRLLSEIESIPWEQLDRVMETHVRNRPPEERPAKLDPVQAYPHVPGPSQTELYSEAEDAGRERIRAGKVAALTVAGGQGTRLGKSVPKGTVEVSPVRNKSLFQLFAETIAVAGRHHTVRIPWYILTSPSNHDQTKAFLEAHGYFGLPKKDVVLFSQGMLPLFDLNGRILMQEKDQICMGPDGHGGSLNALRASGALEDMKNRGIETISYFHVDNPLVNAIDALFIGLHTLNLGDMAIKITSKADELEPVGNVCMADGCVVVIEYMNLPEDVAKERNSDGSRRLDAANLGIHLFEVAFIERIMSGGCKLPYHRAEKSVAYMDEDGCVRNPKSPNAVKLEHFIFDALRYSRKTVVLEVDRADEFSPVKNASGADSVDTARRALAARAVRWIEAAGGHVPKNASGEAVCVIEIAPSFAICAWDVLAKSGRIPRIGSGERVYIE